METQPLSSSSSPSPSFHHPHRHHHQHYSHQQYHQDLHNLYSPQAGEGQQHHHQQQHHQHHQQHQHPQNQPPQFDILDWFPKYQSCVRYFVNVAQHSLPVQTTAAFINILLPFHQSPGVASTTLFQPTPMPSSPHRASIVGAGPSRIRIAGGPGAGPRAPGMVAGSASGPEPAPPSGSAVMTAAAAAVSASASASASASLPASASASASASPESALAATPTSLNPYIRRLVATGFDAPAILHGWFGDDWIQGVGPLRESERRNYLFAAKSETWLRVKSSYDMADGQLIPFLRPLRNVSEEEIQAAEADWSDWLAMQDWMLGPRSPHQPPSNQQDVGSVRVKMEED